MASKLIATSAPAHVKEEAIEPSGRRSRRRLARLSGPAALCAGLGGAPVDLAFHWAHLHATSVESLRGRDLGAPLTAAVRRVGADLARSCVPEYVPSELGQCDLLPLRVR